jgi:hypothetical protein
MTAILWLAAITLIVLESRAPFCRRCPASFLGIRRHRARCMDRRLHAYPRMAAGAARRADLDGVVVAAVGAKRAGASRQAIIGAGIGTFAAIFQRLVGATVHSAGRRCDRRKPCATQFSPCREGGPRHGLACCAASRPRLRLCSRWSGYSCSPCWSSAPSGYDLAPDTSIDDRLVTTPSRCSPESLVRLQCRDTGHSVAVRQWARSAISGHNEPTKISSGMSGPEVVASRNK